MRSWAAVSALRAGDGGLQGLGVGGLGWLQGGDDGGVGVAGGGVEAAGGGLALLDVAALAVGDLQEGGGVLVGEGGELHRQEREGDGRGRCGARRRGRGLRT